MRRISLNVQRSAVERDVAPALERHELEVGDRATVLDALFALQRGPAPDLAFRFSCRVGMCGSCAMLVNGREQLACSTLLKPLPATLRIEPLRNLPVIRDLVVDMKPFFQAYACTLPHFVPRKDLDGFFLIPHGSAEWAALDHQPQCIDCGACYSACTLVTLQPRYFGPMALHRALTLITDPRDDAHKERLATVGSETGAFRCHTLGNCRDVCPRGISPTASIQRLKRLAVFAQFRSILATIFRFEKEATEAGEPGSPAGRMR